MMYVRKMKKTERPSAWLMALGRELRVEYDASMRTSPLSPQLSALIDELQHAPRRARQQRSSVAATTI
jgi:hypothetical protein